MRTQRTGGQQRKALAWICLFLMWFVLAPPDDPSQLAQQSSLQNNEFPGTSISIQRVRQLGTPIKSRAIFAGLSSIPTALRKHPDATSTFPWLNFSVNG